MSASTNHQVYKLLTVNTAPERAARLVAKLAADVRDDFQIVHCGNAEKIEHVRPLVMEHRPDFMCCASMWSPEESAEIKKIARDVIPQLRCLVVPQGMQVKYGPEYTVEYVKSKLRDVIEGDLGLE